MSRAAVKARLSGLYAVTPDVADTDLLAHRVEQVLRGGCGFLQYRNKIATPGLRRSQASVLKGLCRRYHATIVINDHVELAEEIDADGVHVGSDDMALTEARAALGPGKIIGVSCYDQIERARLAVSQGADYVAFGSFFASAVKPGAVRAPLTLLQEARREFQIPLAAIGGITLDNVSAVVAAGAGSVAVISALFAVSDSETASREFCRFFGQQHENA